MKLTRSTVVIIVVALLIAAIGVAQVINRDKAVVPGQDNCCPPDSGKAMMGKPDAPKPAVEKDPHSACPEGEVPGSAEPSGECPYSGGSK